MTPVLAAVTAPVTPILATLTAPVSPILAAVTAPVSPILATLTAPVTPVLAAVTAPVTPVLATLTAPVTPVLAAVTAPVTPILAALTAPVAPVLSPLTAPLTEPLALPLETVEPLTAGVVPATGAIVVAASPTTSSSSSFAGAPGGKGAVPGPMVGTSSTESSSGPLTNAPLSPVPPGVTVVGPTPVASWEGHTGGMLPGAYSAGGSPTPYRAPLRNQFLLSWLLHSASGSSDSSSSITSGHGPAVARLSEFQRRTWSSRRCLPGTPLRPAEVFLGAVEAPG